MNLIQPAYAIINNPVVKNGLEQVTNPIVYTNSVFQTVFSIFFIVGIVYFVWHFVFAGYHFIAAEGDPKKYEQAKNEVAYSITGLFVVFAVFALLKLIGTILGVKGLDGLTISFPSL